MSSSGPAGASNEGHTERLHDDFALEVVDGRAEERRPLGPQVLEEATVRRMRDAHDEQPTGAGFEAAGRRPARARDDPLLDGRGPTVLVGGSPASDLERHLQGGGSLAASACHTNRRGHRRSGGEVEYTMNGCHIR